MKIDFANYCETDTIIYITFSINVTYSTYHPIEQCHAYDEIDYYNAMYIDHDLRDHLQIIHHHTRY